MNIKEFIKIVEKNTLDDENYRDLEKDEKVSYDKRLNNILDFLINDISQKEFDEIIFDESEYQYQMIDVDEIEKAIFKLIEKIDDLHRARSLMAKLLSIHLIEFLEDMVNILDVKDIPVDFDHWKEFKKWNDGLINITRLRQEGNLLIATLKNDAIKNVGHFYEGRYDYYIEFKRSKGTWNFKIKYATLNIRFVVFEKVM